MPAVASCTQHTCQHWDCTCCITQAHLLCSLHLEHALQRIVCLAEGGHVGAVQVKEDVRDRGLCFFDEATRTFALPLAEELAELRIVVATCSAAGLLCHGEYAGQHRSGLMSQRLSFTHIMIDEAGQVGLLLASLHAVTCIQSEQELCFRWPAAADLP